MIKKILFFTFLGLMLSNQFAWGDIHEELEKLNGLKEKLRQEKVSRVNDKVASFNQLKSLEMKVYSWEDRVTELKTKKIDLGEKLYTLQQEQEKIQSEYYESKTREGDLRNFLIDKCEVLRYRINNSSPYQKDERLKKVDSLILSIKNENLDLREGLKQFFNILEEELSLGETCALYTGEIEGKEAKILKIGGIFSAYKSKGETGILQKRMKGEKVIYYWDKNLKSSWIKKLEKVFQTIEKGGEKVKLPLDVTQGTKSKERISKGGFWGWLVRGGPVMIPISALALAILIMIIERFITFRKEYIDADILMTKIMDYWNKGFKKEAIELCETTPGPVARMLKVGLAQHQKGKEVVEETIHEATLHELPKLEKNLSAIGVLATAAPLLGLLGTVSGMISTFQVITYHGGGDPRLLAGGISEALITTEAGLIIAIPALLFHNYLSNRADKIASDMEKNAVKLINSLP